MFIFIAVCYMIPPVRPQESSINNYKVAGSPTGTTNKEAGTPPGAKQSSIDENHGVWDSRCSKYKCFYLNKQPSHV